MKTPSIFNHSFFAGLKPDTKMTVSEWSDRYRMLPQRAASEPGPWKTSRTPYLKEIMDCLSVSNSAQEIVFMKGAQVGGTEAGNNWVGYVVHHAPGPMLYVLPTVETAKRTSKQRLSPMIDEMPILRERIMDARSRDSGNTLLMKEFPNGVLILTGSNSAIGLRSMPARYLFLDEIDAYDSDVDGEGDPVSLAIRRTNTYRRNRKVFKVSTPTIKDHSRIEKDYEASDQRHYHVPCPDCSHMQTIKWDNIKWIDDDPDTAQLCCEACGVLIPEHKKTWMLENGKWIAAAESKVAGFHLNALYSPFGWYSWAEAVAEFIRSKNDPTLLKTWVNTVLGETWGEEGDAPEWQEVADCKQPYPPNTVPVGVQKITCGVDVQKDRLYYSIRGWGYSSESWLINADALYGDTDQMIVWNNLAGLLERTIGEVSNIDLMLVDSGYRADQVYAFCRRFPGRAFPAKGRATMDKPLKPSRIDITMGGRIIKNGMQIWHVNTDFFKSWVHGRIQWPATEPGAWHLHEEATDDYCKQVASEQLIVLSNGKRVWKATGDNHQFDTEVLNAAASNILSVHTFRDPAEIAAQAGAKATQSRKPNSSLKRRGI